MCICVTFIPNCTDTTLILGYLIYICLNSLVYLQCVQHFLHFSKPMNILLLLQLQPPMDPLSHTHTQLAIRNLSLKKISTSYSSITTY